MNLTISGHHLEVTPALRGYVTTKLDWITRHFDQVVDVKLLIPKCSIAGTGLKNRLARKALAAGGTLIFNSLCARKRLFATVHHNNNATV